MAPKSQAKAKAKAKVSKKAEKNSEEKQAAAADKGKPPKSQAAPKEDQQLEAYRNELAEARKNLGFFTAPITTLYLATLWLVDFAVSSFWQVLKSPITWMMVLPLCITWLAAKREFKDLFTPPDCHDSQGGILWQLEFVVYEAGWWLILGILSSVGFGTGLHSGIMFLWPHVMQVVTAAEACQTTEGLVAWYQHPCKLDCHMTSGPKDGSTVTFYRLWMLVCVQCMLWGFGTAVGELPPYMVSRAARLSNSKDEDFEAEQEEARNKTDPFSRMKMWTIDFTKKHGFVGVLLLASWPNAAFDMCGMCCGYVLMPFWTFFIATSIGKGVIKTNSQAAVFVNLFGSYFFNIILGFVDRLNAALAGVIGKDLGLHSLVETGRAKLVLQFELQSRFPPEKLFAGKQSLDLAALTALYAKKEDAEAVAKRVLADLDKNHDAAVTLAELSAAASRTDGKVSLSSLDPGTGTSIMKMCWELFVVGLVLFFVFSLVDQAARSKQQEYDEAKVEKRQRPNKKKD